ncbi:MAG: type II toxin-antitoxin system RelE/ParE family toxin [Pseudoxanthomonas sp.]
MKVFKNAWFERFARKQRITSEALLEAIDRAERGLIDADLGGGVIKQRVARPGQGKSGGFRTIVLYRTSERAFFVYGLPRATEQISAMMKKRCSRRRQPMYSACPKHNWRN